jgi:hypothetical protein
MPLLSWLKGLIDERGSERAREPDPEYNGDAPDLIFQGQALSDQLLAHERTAWADRDFTCTGLKKPVRAKCASPRASLRSVLLGRERLERLIQRF